METVITTKRKKSKLPLTRVRQSILEKPINWNVSDNLYRFIKREGLTCIWCKKQCDPTLKPSADLFPTREHMIRKADGGKGGANLKMACRKCNNTRHRHIPPKEIKVRTPSKNVVIPDIRLQEKPQSLMEWLEFRRDFHLRYSIFETHPNLKIGHAIKAGVFREVIEHIKNETPKTGV